MKPPRNLKFASARNHFSNHDTMTSLVCWNQDFSRGNHTTVFCALLCKVQHNQDTKSVVTSGLRRSLYFGSFCQCNLKPGNSTIFFYIIMLSDLLFVLLLNHTLLSTRFTIPEVTWLWNVWDHTSPFASDIHGAPMMSVDIIVLLQSLHAV